MTTDCLELDVRGVACVLRAAVEGAEISVGDFATAAAYALIHPAEVLVELARQAKLLAG